MPELGGGGEGLGWPWPLNRGLPEIESDGFAVERRAAKELGVAAEAEEPKRFGIEVSMRGFLASLSPSPSGESLGFFCRSIVKPGRVPTTKNVS